MHFPVTIAYQNGNDTSRSGAFFLQRRFQFFFPDKLRTQCIGTHQHDYQVRRFEFIFDAFFPVLAGQQVGVHPFFNEFVFYERVQMSEQFVFQLRIGTGINDKSFKRDRHIFFSNIRSGVSGKNRHYQCIMAEKARKFKVPSSIKTDKIQHTR